MILVTIILSNLIEVIINFFGKLSFIYYLPIGRVGCDITFINIALYFMYRKVRGIRSGIIACDSSEIYL